jgi:hypothetical protein
MAKKVFAVLTISTLCLAGILVVNAFTPTARHGYYAPTTGMGDAQIIQPDPAAQAAMRDRQTANALDDIRKQLDRQEFDRKHLWR